MAPPKKSNYKKRYTAQKKTYRNIRSSLISNVPKVWTFRRSFTKFDFATTTVAQIGYSFKFNELPNYAEFKAMFESYQIKYVQLRFFYTNTSAASNTHSAGYFYFLRDYNDSNNPASLNEMLENSDVKICRMTDLNGKYFTQKIYPKISMEVYKTAITTSYATPKTNPFMDLTNDDGATPHFGFKIGYDQLSTGAYLRCIATMVFKCKDMK